ncbi:Rpn family recombination-promoting nuclease/putative transposase [Treponema sp. C6A8]|uniref:Rpn family recombination-promoting nuclease/putative transposase n=1 Tax=Treponema sp. C6A8 TaxID=1410609 RepID=UPI00068450B8|nr:Rpn family recombination-promoting nuclease/putative transposase [Treponema sp. C6A8]
MTNKIYDRKPVDELTFADDGMFQEVMREPQICAELIERLLHIKVGHVEYPELEKQIKPFYTTKGVRLDVYLKDNEKVIDVELQCYPQDALGKRTRYYQSMLDMDTLMKGQDYTELKESYVLFICKQEPFFADEEKKKPYGLPCYTFKNTCAENADVNLNDKSVKVIYNSKAYKSVKDEKIRTLLQYISTNEPGKDAFTNRLSEIVEKIKENEKFRSDYAAMNLHDRDIMRMAKKEGREEGAQEKAIDAARSLYENGVSIELIAKSLKMTEEQVKEIVSAHAKEAVTV